MFSDNLERIMEAAADGMATSLENWGTVKICRGSTPPASDKRV